LLDYWAIRYDKFKPHDAVVESLKEKVQDGLLEVNNEFITQPSNLRQAQVITLLACHNQPIAIKSRSSSQSAQEETLCGRP